MQRSDERIHLHADGVAAEIGTIGARLLSLRVGRHDLTQPVTASTPHEVYNGVVLAPWPNRVRDGRWMLDGQPQQLDITEPARGGALHGLLSFAEYRVSERTPASVTLAATIPAQHGWPFVLETSVRYDLHAQGITVTHEAVNRSASRAPWAVGAHPYLRVGGHPVETLVVRIPTATVFETDAQLNAVREIDAAGSAVDLSGGPVVGDLDLDTAYRLAPQAASDDGFVVAARLEAGDGTATLLLQSADWEFVQVFTTLVYPGDGGPIGAIAIEPMTAPPDALNSGIGLRWIAPGDTWRGSWALRRERS